MAETSSRTVDELAPLRRLPWPSAVRLVILHRSRARGEAHEGSDWDFGVLADDPVDLTEVIVMLTEALGELLAERAANVERHLRRVADHVPAEPDRLTPLTT
jgi:predicted nucleotidyltransferase